MLFGVAVKAELWMKGQSSAAEAWVEIPDDDRQ